MPSKTSWAVVVMLTLVPGCTDRAVTGEEPDPGLQGDGGWVMPDGGGLCADPGGDPDGDGIPSGVEGCHEARDTDNDQLPDWQDSDSDGDRIPDAVERGERSPAGWCASPLAQGYAPWPCDSDGDRLPDYRDLDSDNDRLPDATEDRNGDGLVGCCLTRCFSPGSPQQQSCKLTSDGCGAGQKCSSGGCTPAAAFNCANGESDYRRKDRWIPPDERGTFICRDATEDKPQGRRPVLYKKSDAARGDWHLALEKTATYGEMTIANPGSKMFAAAIDHDDNTEEVAGFVLSRDTSGDVQSELTALIAGLQSSPPGGSGGKVTLRASGTPVHSHDLYASVQGTFLDLTLGSASDVSSIRNAIVASFLGKSLTDLTNLPQSYGGSSSAMVLRLTTLKRVELKKDATGKVLMDASGKPQTTGDKNKWRLMVIGAVAAMAEYQDPRRNTGFIVDDLGNGTALALAGDTPGEECDVGTIANLPIADIIWVIDESGSMADNRQEVVNNANNFFSRALSSGLDFRMGVTNVCSPTGTYKATVGKFCARISSSSTDSGGSDRFLLPSEQTIFSSCIKNPPGLPGGKSYSLTNATEAVKAHLPRASGDPSKIRPNATLVIIAATDKIAASLSGVAGGLTKTCTASAAQQAAIDAALSSTWNLLAGITDPEAAAIYHVIGGVCANGCGAQYNHGQWTLARRLGGQVADVCQKNLGNSLQAMVDQIVGAASPVVLDYVPIAASLAAAMDAIAISRSRTSGFDFRSSSNSLVFINVKYKKGSEVVAAYKRWTAQTILR
jgi:hypothetical protein